MKHAIMVMGYGDYSILQKTINVLDDNDIDFIIHWDKKFKLPNLFSEKSQIIFIKNRIKVNWGSDAQIIAEKLLFDYVVAQKKYDYVHLISSSDIPLMSSQYFKTFFKKESYYLGFLDYIQDEAYQHVNEYYPFRHLKVKNRYSIPVLVHYINKLFKVNRLKKIHVEKGCNWFSMDAKYLNEVVKYPYFNIFKYTYTGDEFYVQTILRKLKPDGLTRKYDYYSDSYRMTKSSAMALRYIDWFKGRPYTFNLSDVNELRKIKNTDYAFARKVVDPKMIDEIFNK